MLVIMAYAVLAYAVMPYAVIGDVALYSYWPSFKYANIHARTCARVDAGMQRRTSHFDADDTGSRRRRPLRRL